MKSTDGTTPLGNKPIEIDRLALYDQYSAMAYGVILQLIPQPTLAQEVLADLFTGPQINQCADSPTSVACTIIRLARSKALEANRMGVAPVVPELASVVNDPTPAYVFDMAFRQGYALTAIANRLRIPYTDVMKSIRDYFRYLRTS